MAGAAWSDEMEVHRLNIHPASLHHGLCPGTQDLCWRQVKAKCVGARRYFPIGKDLQGGVNHSPFVWMQIALVRCHM